VQPDVLEQFLGEVGLEPEGLVVDDDPVQVLHQQLGAAGAGREDAGEDEPEVLEQAGGRGRGRVLQVQPRLDHLHPLPLQPDHLVPDRRGEVGTEPGEVDRGHEHPGLDPALQFCSDGLIEELTRCDRRREADLGTDRRDHPGMDRRRI